MAGGLETALLIGAATGAGTSALTGGDPLKGALFGALGGGVTSGLGGALGGAQAGAVGNVGANVAGSTVASAADDIALAATRVPFGSTTVGQTSLNSIPFGGTTVDPSKFANVGLNMPSGGVDPSLLGSNVGANLPVSAIPTATVPQTGFMDIFKSTPGGPDLKQRLGNYIVQNPGQAAMSGGSLANTLFNQPDFSAPSDEYEGPLKRFRFNPSTYRPAFADGGGITDIDLGSTARLTGSPVTMMASGGIADLGSYSDGGRLLKGPGDGMSDSIPARIGRRQPARLADGEFVVPADVVSHLGNGSTDAGAKQLYDMMDKVRRARTGNKKQGREINPRKFVPA